MRKLVWRLFLVFISLGMLVCSSCKRDTGPDDSISAEDYTNISSSLAETADDATAASGQVQGISGKADGWQALCGVSTIDTGTGHQILITYDGMTKCQGMIRSGQISVSLISGLRWREQNASIVIKCNNLTFTNSSTGAYYILNGTDTVTNETGGLAWEIMTGIEINASVRHRQKSTNLNITYTSGVQRIWGQDLTETYSSKVSGTQNIITITDFSENTGNIEMWGTTGTGDYFTNAIVDSIKANNYSTSCSWRPYQGEDILKISNRSADILFGVDDNGNPIGSATSCPYGYKITYSKGKKILTKIIAYIF